MIKTLLSTIMLLSSVFSSTAIFAQGNSSQAIVDDKVLTEYFRDNKIKATRTPSGLYYVINKKGTGENAKVGQKVSMNYYGKFLDGRRFDSNMDENYNGNGNPIAFPLGKGYVIAGWDQGIQFLNPGCRATFYIPSSLGYGPQGKGPVPPNTIMVFDVELVSVAN